MKPETRWKILAILALLAMTWLAISWWTTARELGKAGEIIDKYATEELERQGYDDGVFKVPTIPDAPLGTKPILRAEGRVRYPPRTAIVPVPIPVVDAWTTTQPVTVADVTIPRSTPATIAIPNCNLDDLDITVNCQVDALATPTRPWAKLVTSGTISAWGQVRELPPTPAGDVHLEMTPAVVPPTWRADILTGVAAGERFGVVVGAQWSGKSRVGGFALAEWQPAAGDTATWRVIAGASVRVK